MWLGEDCASIRHIGLTSVWQRACLVSWWLGIACAKTWWFWSVMRCGSIKNLLQLLASACRCVPSTRNVIIDPTGKPSNRNVARCAGLFFQLCSDQRSFTCSLDTKFCSPHRRWDLRRWQLRALGRKNRDFNVIGGSWKVLCSGVPLGSSARFWDGCRLWEINSRVWNRKELKRLLQMFETQLDCQWIQVLMFLVVPSPYLSMSW